MLLSACSSGSSTTSSGTGTPAGPSVPAAARFIYTIQPTNTIASTAFIDIFPATATGTVAPAATLVLPTGSSPASLVTDSSGQIYVGCQTPDQVLIYPPGSMGNATPTRTIDVSSVPFAIAVDASGLLYVEGDGADGTPRVSVYSATATGSSAPLRTVAPAGIQLISALTTDASGNLYVAGETPTNRGSISVYPTGANGSLPPSRTIQSAFNFSGMTVDSSGDLFVTTYGPNEVQLVEYSPSASGAALPINTFSLSTPIMNSSFIGSVTQDAAGNLYFAANDALFGDPNPPATIYTLAPNLSSASNPTRTFTPASSTQLVIAVH